MQIQNLPLVHLLICVPQVLISFFVSIVLVIVAISWAYRTDRLPCECYNEFDNLVLGRKARSRDGEAVQTFRGFMLVMSDQQLLSGLALVIIINITRSGVADLDTQITGYAYSNAVILAFFSCAIHLATLGSLRGYLMERGALKHVRVVLMLSVFFLLLQALVDAWWMLHPTLPLRCALQESRDIGYYLVTGPHLNPHDVLLDIGNVTGFAILIGILANGYLRRILALYSPNLQEPFNTRAWQIRLASSARLLPTSIEQEQIAHAKTRLSERWSPSSLNLKSFPGFCFMVIIPAFNQSFMFEIVWMLFYFLFGFSQLFVTLLHLHFGEDNYRISSLVSTEPDFGQLLPLLLLGLPLLAIFEGISGKFANQVK